MADGSVRLPGIGEIPKQYVYIGGAVAVGVVGYAWFTREPAVDEYQIDEGDIGEGDDAYVNPAPGGSTVDSEPVDPELLPPTTNAEWTKRAVAYLESLNYNPQTVMTAIGKYLGRQVLSAAQADIIRQAIAAIGSVPVGEYFILTSQTPDPDPKPKPPAKPKPKPPAKPIPAKPKPKPKKPPTRTKFITRSGQSLSSLVADYNRQYRTGFSRTQIWNFNLRWRSASTVATMKKRGPDLVYRGSSFWFPINPSDIDK